MALRLVYVAQILDLGDMLQYLEYNKMYINSNLVKTIEELSFDYGLMAYVTKISFQPSSPAVIPMRGLRDRGYVYIDKELQVITDSVFTTMALLQQNSTLVIVVENQGRICFGDGVADCKGLLNDVKFDQLILDAFLRLHEFTKGYLWLNRHPLKRYWPGQGPQLTLYAPGALFRGNTENLIIIEQEDTLRIPSFEFVKDHLMNGAALINRRQRCIRNN
ncbi:beta-galactosidase-like [Tropilaelaps mercedesae]|uniref:Beta-galactosidase-like n=1 Tax=Tropilaelaps mercedesae TaxID=418985 RepID=A0A1V9XDT6_9ACAR|nr:beta-galactosidase-like [Tropilaelaps mercedesae]